MEYIQINCNECNIIKRSDTILIDFNYNDVKNIIDSNYITYILFCDHKTKELMNITTKVHYLPSGLRYTSITNINYLETYNRFEVKEDKKTLKILLNNYHPGKVKEVNIEEFINVAKKGSIILFYSSTLIQQLEKVLLEHNSDFIFKRIIKAGHTFYIVDTPNYTKSASKNL